MEQVKIEPSPDVAHRGWLANLKQGDRVEVPYSPAKGDIKLMTVFESDDVWIRLLPDGFSKVVDNTILVDAVSGVLHYAPVRIVPPGTTDGKMPGKEYDRLQARKMEIHGKLRRSFKLDEPEELTLRQELRGISARQVEIVIPTDGHGKLNARPREQQNSLFGASPVPPVSPEQFEDQTHLLIQITIDMVVDEILEHFRGEERFEVLHAYLTAESLNEKMTARTCAAYTIKSFRANCLTSDPRNFFRGFMRHWMSAAMKQDLPAFGRRLPDRFCIGHPLTR
jgi:hypothetical protein